MGRILIFRAHGAQLENLDIDADTLDEATLKTAHGIYTVFRINPGRRVLRLNRHLERMRRSAVLLDQPYAVAEDWLVEALRRAVIAAEQGGLASPRVRLTVPFDAPDSALIAMEPFTPPPAKLYVEGVRMGVVTAHRDAPRAKNSTFIAHRQQLQAEHPGEFYEILLRSDDGYLLEGVGSNFYAVLDGTLHTAEDGVLPGIARSVLLEVAPDVLPVSLEPVHWDDLPRVAEAMLTSASRGIVPIVQIEDTPINGGRPGPVFDALRARYDALVERELEPL